MSDKLLWFAAAFVPCRDCHRPTRARPFEICAGCLRRRWMDGENWPFPNDWKKQTEKRTDGEAEDD